MIVTLAIYIDLLKSCFQNYCRRLQSQKQAQVFFKVDMNFLPALNGSTTFQRGRKIAYACEFQKTTKSQLGQNNSWSKLTRKPQGKVQKPKKLQCKSWHIKMTKWQLSKRIWPQKIQRKAKLEYSIPSESKRVIVLKGKMFLNNFFSPTSNILKKMVPVGRSTLAKPRPWMRNSQI